MKSKLFLASLLATAVSGTAAAETAFDGPYVGLELGYSKTKLKAAPVEKEPGDVTVGIGDSGVRFGGVAGYRRNLGGFVIGAEARIGDSDNKILLDTFEDYDGDFVDATAGSGFEWSLNATAGFAPTDNFLIYGLVGWANMDGKVKVGDESESQNLDGIRFGVGLEYAISTSISLRATATRSDYGNLLSKEDAEDIGANVGVKQNQLDLGLVFNF